MGRISIVVLAAVLLSGCSTPGIRTSQPLTQDEINRFVSQARDPRHYWITVYSSSDGPVYQNAHRLHPGHYAIAPFLEEKVATTPVVALTSHRGQDLPALIDTSSRYSWCGIDASRDLGLIPLSPPANTRIPTHVSGGMDGYLCLSPKAKLGTLHMESPLFFCRFATGSLDALTRGASTPEPRVVLGCEFMKAFEFVQIDYINKRCIVAADTKYSPHADLLMTETRLKEIDGAFGVSALIDGVETMVILDSAGDFELIMPEDTVQTVNHLGIAGIAFRNIQVTPAQDAGMMSPRYPRLGKRLLAKYRITLAPRDKKVYFERPAPTSE